MSRTWQEIAAEAAKEKDSQKLLELAVELDLALEERDNRMQKSAHPSQRSGMENPRKPSRAKKSA
jgi:hypothetical protein